MPHLLGGTIKAVYTTSNPLSDFDSLTETGIYRFDNDAAINNAENKPDNGIKTPAYVEVKKTSSGQQFQILHGLMSATGGGYIEVVYERKIGSPKTPWSRLDNFGCNTLAELKAALANV